LTPEKLYFYVLRIIGGRSVEYCIELGNNDTVFGVPISLCLDAPINIINYNGGNYSALHNVRTWVKHIAGAEPSEKVSTFVTDPILIELIKLNWNSCLSKMSEFDDVME